MKPSRARYDWTPFHDAQIARVYRDREKRGVARLAREWGYSIRAISDRARRIHVRQPGIPRRNGGWSQEEEAILLRHVHRGHQYVLERLTEAGYPRSREAVRTHLYWLRQDGRMPSPEDCREERRCMTITETARLLGIHVRSVRIWIRQGWLAAKSGGDCVLINRSKLRQFLIDHVSQWNPGRADKWWLIDLLADNSAEVETARRRRLTKEGSE